MSINLNVPSFYDEGFGSMFPFNTMSYGDKTDTILTSDSMFEYELYNGITVYINKKGECFIVDNEGNSVNILEKLNLLDYLNLEIKFYVSEGELFFKNEKGFSGLEGLCIFDGEYVRLEYLNESLNLENIEHTSSKISITTQGKILKENTTLVHILQKSLSMPQIEGVDNFLDYKINSLSNLSRIYLTLGKGCEKIVCGENIYYMGNMKCSVINSNEVLYKQDGMLFFSVDSGLPIFNNHFSEINYIDLQGKNYVIGKNNVNGYYYIYSLDNAKWIATGENKIVSYKIDKRYKKHHIKIKVEGQTVMGIGLWEYLDLPK